MTLIPKGIKPKRIRETERKDKKHLAFVASLPCCVSGRYPVVVHHLMEDFPDKIGRRDDKYTIPLHPDYHNNARGVHGVRPEGASKEDSPEKAFLKARGIDGGTLADKLWRTYHGFTHNN